MLDAAASAAAELPEKLQAAALREDERATVHADRLTAERTAERAFNEAGTSNENWKMAVTERKIMEATQNAAIDAANANLDNVRADTLVKKATEGITNSSKEAVDRNNAVYDSVPWLPYLEKIGGAIPRVGIDFQGASESHRGSDSETTRARGGSSQTKRQSQEYRSQGRRFRMR